MDVGSPLCRDHAVEHPIRPAAWMPAGVDLYTISKLLRHASIAMTERYTHLSRGDLKAAVNRKPVSE